MLASTQFNEKLCIYRLQPVENWGSFRIQRAVAKERRALFRQAAAAAAPPPISDTSLSFSGHRHSRPSVAQAPAVVGIRPLCVVSSRKSLHLTSPLLGEGGKENTRPFFPSSFLSFSGFWGRLRFASIPGGEKEDVDDEGRWDR